MSSKSSTSLFSVDRRSKTSSESTERAFLKKKTAIGAQHCPTQQLGKGCQPFDQRMPRMTPSDGLNMPKFLARLKRGASTIDLSKGSENASAQEPARMSSIKANEEVYSGKASDNLTLCYSDNAV